MAIYVIDTIQQKGTAEFPIVGDEDLGGGFRVVDTVVDRDAILTVYRKTGMFVFTTATSQLWYWTGVGNAWIEWTSGAAAGNATIDTLVAAETILAGDPVSLNNAGAAINSDAFVGSGNRQDIYGVAILGATFGNPLVVTTSGVHAYSGAAPLPATMGVPIYLGVGAGAGGSWSSTPPDPATSPAGTRIARIGYVRTSGSILVRPQVIAQV